MAVSLAEVWRLTVARAPAAPAVIDGAEGRVWSRNDLAAAAQDWRAQLPSDARLDGHRVVMAEPNGIGWWRTFLGLVETGALPVPLDPTEPPERQQMIAREIGAAWLWHGGQLEMVQRARVERRKDLCLLKVTSGTTGAPRALAFTHSQMLADSRQICATMGITPDDLNLAVIPLGHSYGLGNLVLPLLDQGTAMVTAASPLPHALARDCARWRPTVFPAVPTLLRALVRSDASAADWQSLRLVISAGAPLPADVAQAFLEKFGRRVHGFYGTSETGGICFDGTGDATLAGTGVGTPLIGVTLEFGPNGRFVVASAAVGGRGHFSPPDRGRWDARLGLSLVGRVGRSVKIGARRLDLAEIEAALRAVPGVRDAFVMPHPAQVDALAAAVVGQVQAEAVRAHLRDRISAWKLPSRLLVLADFPTTARGKTDTHRLRQLLSEAPAAAGGGKPAAPGMPFP